MCSQVCLPCPLGDLRVGHGRLGKLLGQGLANPGVKGNALAQQGRQVVKDLNLASVRRLHTEQQATHALDLAKGTEYRVAQLQFHSQPLVDRALQ